MPKTKIVTRVEVPVNEVMVIKPNRPMTKAEFKLLANQVAEANKTNAVQVNLIPYSTKFLGTAPVEVKE